MSYHTVAELNCPECNITYETTYEYCHNCGEELVPSVESSEASATRQLVGDEYYCGNCGSEVESTAESCPDCGTRIK